MIILKAMETVVRNNIAFLDKSTAKVVIFLASNEMTKSKVRPGSSGTLASWSVLRVRGCPGGRRHWGRFRGREELVTCRLLGLGWWRGSGWATFSSLGRGEGGLADGFLPAQNERIPESFRLAKTSKVTKSNGQPNPPMPAKPCPQGPHPDGF